MRPRRYQLRKEAVGVALHHPWIFRDHLSSAASVFRDGDLLRLVDGGNRVVGYGFYEAIGAIAIRMLRRGPLPPNAAWLRGQLAAAVARRAELATRTDAVRLVHGESDGIPAVVVDRFADTLVVSSYSAGADALARYAARALDPASPIDRTGEDPRPTGNAVGVPTPRDSASPIDPTGEDPRPTGNAVGVPTPRDSASPIDPTGEDPRPTGNAVGVPTPRDSASPIDPTGEDPRPAGNAVGVPTPRDSASPIDPTGEDPRPTGNAVGVPTPRDSASPIVGPARHVVLRPARLRHAPAEPARTLRGSPPELVRITEGGLVLAVDLATGQKTGTYLDLRGLRREVAAAPLAGARVLNLFAYAGMLGLAAELAGATAIVQVDASERALAFAAAHHVRTPAHHTFVVADVFAWLPGFAAEPFDLVIVDPPAMTSKATQVPSVLAAYRKLYRAAGQLVRRGGALVAACCTSRIERSVFHQTVREALGERFSLDHEIPPEPDHPVGFPQADYLKIGWWARSP